MIESQQKSGKPLAERMRPRRMEDMVGQTHLLGSDCLIPKSLKNRRIFSMILWGPPGSGKTTLARLIGEVTQLPFKTFSAVTSGLKDLRQIVKEAGLIKADSGKTLILFVDEIHRFNKAQQDAFLPHVENGLIVLIGATTQNPSFEIIPPLLSRTRVLVLNPLGKNEIKTILYRALKDKINGLGDESIFLNPDALEYLVETSGGDARVALNNLEAGFFYIMESQSHPLVLDQKVFEKILDKKPLPYDKNGEAHYDLISAFHKSLRGGDTQASVYWLYRMLVAGEDPLFIGRRMIRFASEDVGLADPNALRVALAAFEAWQKVGPPEAELALTQAAVYLAAAPKSNSLYLAERAAKQSIEKHGAQPVPLHIRNAPTALMKELGYGRGYRYPHNYPQGYVDQDYLPKKIKNEIFYRPTHRGFEREIARRIRTSKVK